MADNIRVVDSELQACVTAYRNAFQTLQSCVRLYETALNALKSDWTGRAFAIMLVKVVDLITKIKESFDRVNDAMSELQQVEALFEENEQKLQSNFNALDAGSASPFNG